jgi:predicted small lipoprotein YifL
MPLVKILPGIVALALLSACGSKGPLYLPQRSGAAQQGPQAARQNTNRQPELQPLPPNQVGVSRPNEFSSHSILTQ